MANLHGLTKEQMDDVKARRRLLDCERLDAFGDACGDAAEVTPELEAELRAIFAEQFPNVSTDGVLSDLHKTVLFCEQIAPRWDWSVSRDGDTFGDGFYYGYVACENGTTEGCAGETPPLALMSGLMSALVRRMDLEAEWAKRRQAML